MRQAINTTHHHLKSFYTFRIVKGVGVRCLFEIPAEELPLVVERNLEEVNEPADFWKISEDISLDIFNTRYIQPVITDEEFISLELLAETKNLKVSYHNNILEIIK